MYIDSLNTNNQDYALNSFGNVLICSNTILETKTVTFPVGYNLDTNLSFRVCFVNGHNCANASTNMTLNNVPVVVNKYGTLTPLPIHTMTESNQTVYKSLQPNTILEMYYTANYDGNNHPAFVVIGNPVVLSSADYTIYADGSDNYVYYPLGFTYVQLYNPTNNTWEKTPDQLGMKVRAIYKWSEITSNYSSYPYIKIGATKQSGHNKSHNHDGTTDDTDLGIILSRLGSPDVIHLETGTTNTVGFYNSNHHHTFTTDYEPSDTTLNTVEVNASGAKIWKVVTV